ncbi:CD1845 family protein [Hydrogenoanaerobacterium sp.]|uniref:CD1845 family protein n=1 Tax=Hydrogenoanaerobacterium sp. TaxID=2953763 RepID=UPI0028A291B2|nr:CD1845 family protein [Hydrogenoanaerobacterium sp.]
MNAKLKKVLSDMNKIEDKMVLLQEKWDELNKQKTEFENLEIIGLAIMVLLGEVEEGLKALLAAYLISPYGIPMFATWLVGAVDGLNQRLKSI